ncbi:MULTISPECIES: PfkB family carbohydrate kinase [unclassified Schaalia]|uniref:PfkB family carbohydrate kinase n=1 Tax=unclassified Schaalia TaxID=2691889 RepID=UPI001E62A632|nr:MULTISPECIES: PfkB family carbohydrate kinase [unclassified Schaalia]MCD4549632.1 PfkB family carbohydrate kinase [Schaalia sp. lx-260]MCD4556695.1 PfkB family carbohydrate kinase [Schaalia sp. lx-100]
MSGRFISTHSVVLVLPLNIHTLPERGGSVKAATAMSRPGGGFTTLSAAASMGAHAALASPLGTGPNSSTVRQQLASAGIQLLTQELVGDIGVAIQLLEADGSMTSVVTAGVESEPSRAALDSLVLKPGDVIHISGADLAVPSAVSVLAGWGAALPASVTLVLSIAQAVEQVPVWAWKQLLRRADVVTMNVRESHALQRNLNASEPGTDIRHLMRPDASLVRRIGAKGSQVHVNEDAPFIDIPAFSAVTVDTAGVGDTHIGTMCAALAQKHSLEEACRWANAAAAIAISHESALPVPSRAQVEDVLNTGKVQPLNL